MRYLALLAGLLALTSCLGYTDWSHDGVKGATWAKSEYDSRSETFLIMECRTAPSVAHDTLSLVTVAWGNYEMWELQNSTGDGWGNVALDLLLEATLAPRGGGEQARDGISQEARRLGGDAVI